MDVIAEIPVDRASARVFEHGWQSWSPTASYAVGEAPHRAREGPPRVMNTRPGLAPPPDVYQGEGLLAVEPGAGEPVRVFGTADPAHGLTSIRAEPRDGTLVLSVDGDVEEQQVDGSLQAALAAWADGVVSRLELPRPRAAPSVWCSWYDYWGGVTAADILENLDAMDELELPVEVVQIDDGFQAELGDWLDLKPGFTPLAELAARIADRGRRTGIWVAPFLVGERSRLAREHPDWLVHDLAPGHHHWEQDLHPLDVTHPAAAEHLQHVFRTLAGWGISYFKIDFIYGGLLDGRRHDPDASGLDAYRLGLRLIREAIGDAYLLGCGAPIVPSLGLVDAMRIGPDCGPEYEPPHGDLSAPSQRSATVTSRSRAFMHDRFWINDPDCLLARPAIERREEWAATLAELGGLRASSDRLRSLDEWGVGVTRSWLAG